MKKKYIQPCGMEVEVDCCTDGTVLKGLLGEFETSNPNVEAAVDGGR